MNFPLLLLASIIACVSSHDLKVYNHCPFTIWIGTLGNFGHSTPQNGGFQLGEYQARTFSVPNGWQGRLWGRTNCNSAGQCETGDCGNKIQCNGAGGRPPVTLAEITFDGYGNIDYYDISLVDGYNLPVAMKPIDGTFVNHDPSSRYTCTWAGCNKDLNAICPNELAQKNSGGWTVACRSACETFQTDQYCCRGQYNTPQTCKRQNWPVDYPSKFKEACPLAYSYAYDDELSTFTMS